MDIDELQDNDTIELVFAAARQDAENFLSATMPKEFKVIGKPSIEIFLKEDNKD